MIFLLSLWVFRGVIAALLPSLMGGVVIFGSFLAIGLINEAMALSIYALNLAIGLSLGLAIDYSLLIISRYREEMAKHGPGREAISRTLRTAGKSVLFSAITVAAALAGLMVFPQRFLFSMGIAGVMVALIAAAIALIVLPAVLDAARQAHQLARPEVVEAEQRGGRPARRPPASGTASRSAVMRRPAPIAAATAIFLLVVAFPAFNINFTSVDANVLPTSAAARQVSDTIAHDFPQDRSQPDLPRRSPPRTRPRRRPR